METFLAVLYTSTVILLLFLLIFFVLFLVATIISATTQITFVGSSRRKIRSILSYTKPQPGQTFFDLGSGDGRVVFEAARTFELKATGVEFNPLLVYFSKSVARLMGIHSTTFLRQDALDVNLKKADIIYLFLLPKLLEPLSQKFKKECKPGTIIISHGFQIKGFKTKLIHHKKDTPFSTYYYKL